MKVSPKEIIESIEAKIGSVLTDEIVKYDYVYSVDQIDTDSKKDYPRVYCAWNESADLNDNYNSVTLAYYFCDVMFGKSSSIQRDYEIKSDMLQAASKLFDDLSREEFFQSATPSISYTPFSNRFDNGISGVEVTVTLALEKPCYNV